MLSEETSADQNILYRGQLFASLRISRRNAIVQLQWSCRLDGKPPKGFELRFVNISADQNRIPVSRQRRGVRGLTGQASGTQTIQQCFCGHRVTASLSYYVYCVCISSGNRLLVLFLLLVQDLATLDPSNFSLFSFRPPAMDLTTAYRYNQNMMEYYTCKSKSYL
ncbi:hypothetical protein L9F63_006907 [Diploptera punctata]|uniref:Uncharacterized protein n=1 Tax=Diploptera punctata TaxID=6984 RepID=A0AAD7Z8T2_DIPPU|nr:hypothetical protein L9F63_006907 [Diploptera punctata]